MPSKYTRKTSDEYQIKIYMHLGIWANLGSPYTSLARATNDRNKLRIDHPENKYRVVRNRVRIEPIISNDEAEVLEELGYETDQYYDLMAIDTPWNSTSLEDKIKWSEFGRALREHDFSEGDSFWLNNIEFTVTKTPWKDGLRP